MLSERINWKFGLAFLTVIATHVLCFYWWRSSDYFFSGDGLFYFSRKITSPAEVWRRLTTLDELYMYRPLPYIVFSYLLYPIFGTSPAPYHLISYLAALVNAVLACIAVYFWTGRNTSLTLLASVFVLLNPVNFFPSFGLEYLDVWLSILFYNLALVLIIKNGKFARLLIPLLSVLALLSREHSVLLPIEAMLILITMGFSPRESFSKTRSAWVVFALYAALQLYIRSGVVFAPENANENLRFHFSAARIEQIVKGFKPAIFFPENPNLDPVLGNSRRYVRLAFVIPWFLMIIWAIFRRNRLALSGLIWVPISLLPIAFINMPPFPRHYYMALPGLAVLFCSFVASTRFIIPLALTFSMVLVSNVDMYADQSYAAVGGRLTKMYFGEIQRTAARSGRSDFYVVASGDPYFQWHIDSGMPLREFLSTDVSFRFASSSQPVVMDRLLSNKVNVVVPKWEGLQDAILTGQFPTYPQTDYCAPALQLLHADVPCAVFYRGMQLRNSDKGVAETPTGRPLFETNKEIVMLSRTTLFLRNSAGLRLAGNGVVSPASADGLFLQIFTVAGNRFHEWRTIQAAPGQSVHMDERIEASESPLVVLRVSPGAKGDERGDWLIWHSD